MNTPQEGENNLQSCYSLLCNTTYRGIDGELKLLGLSPLEKMETTYIKELWKCALQIYNSINSATWHVSIIWKHFWNKFSTLLNDANSMHNTGHWVPGTEGACHLHTTSSVCHRRAHRVRPPWKPAEQGTKQSCGSGMNCQGVRSCEADGKPGQLPADMISWCHQYCWSHSLFLFANQQNL